MPDVLDASVHVTCKSMEICEILAVREPCGERSHLLSFTYAQWMICTKTWAPSFFLSHLWLMKLLSCQSWGSCCLFPEKYRVDFRILPQHMSKPKFIEFSTDTTTIRCAQWLTGDWTFFSLGVIIQGNREKRDINCSYSDCRPIIISKCIIFL